MNAILRLGMGTLTVGMLAAGASWMWADGRVWFAGALVAAAAFRAIVLVREALRMRAAAAKEEEEPG